SRICGLAQLLHVGERLGGQWTGRTILERQRLRLLGVGRRPIAVDRLAVWTGRLVQSGRRLRDGDTADGEAREKEAEVSHWLSPTWFDRGRGAALARCCQRRQFVDRCRCP